MKGLYEKLVASQLRKHVLMQSTHGCAHGRLKWWIIRWFQNSRLNCMRQPLVTSVIWVISHPSVKTQHCVCRLQELQPSCCLEALVFSTIQNLLHAGCLFWIIYWLSLPVHLQILRASTWATLPCSTFGIPTPDEEHPNAQHVNVAHVGHDVVGSGCCERGREFEVWRGGGRGIWEGTTTPYRGSDQSLPEWRVQFSILEGFHHCFCKVLSFLLRESSRFLHA